MLGYNKQLLFNINGMNIKVMLILMNYINKIKLYVLRQTQLCVCFIIFNYWLQVSARMDHHQANIYKTNLKKQVHILINIQLCQMGFIINLILLIYFTHNAMSSTKF